MFSKIACISLILAVCQAASIPDHQAISSQSIIRHDQPNQISLQHGQQILQQAPQILQHSAPILQQPQYLQQSGHLIQQQPAQFIQHSAPLIHHSSPLIQQHSTQLLQHSAPILQHSAPILQHAAPVAIAHAAQIEQHAPAKYEFSYSVEDPHTGDHKSQHESRDGDVVKGEYSLLQPDGSIRKVEYTADDHSGFNAIVHNSAPSAHVQAAPVHDAPTQLIHSAPVQTQLIQSAPIQHAQLIQPVQQQYIQAPQQHYVQPIQAHH